MHPHGRHHHGNPDDLDAYIRRMEEPSRDEWQRPDEVLRALAVRPGDAVADVGAGPGYFTLRLARAVGPHGHVYAVDAVPEMIGVLRERIQRAGLGNVTTLVARDGDTGLQPASYDLVLIVDTFHHFPDGAAYLARLGASLKPEGRIANIDFHARETPVGPPLEQRISREAFLAEAARAGLVVVDERTFLPYQYFVVMRPR
jgi:ubiquinone/menaquinone biosynthesis C-methylase UbiE